MKTLGLAVGLVGVLALSGCASNGTHAHGDFGTPSDQYPVEHTPLPQMQYFGGSVQSAPVLYAVTAAGDPLAAQLADFTSKVGGSGYWLDAVGEYGVGRGTFGGAVTIAPPAATITGEELKSIVRGMLDGTHPEWGAPSINANYIVYLPDGVQISDPNGTSCASYGAYHGTLVVGSGPYAGAVAAYSAIPRCPPEEFGFQKQLDELAFVTSHEITEAATDPGVEIGDYGWATFAQTDGAWNLASGGEVADICVFAANVVVTPGDLGYPVQRVWSNARAAASHDPCQPAEGPYFNASPVLSDTTTNPNIGPGSAVVKIPVGESRPIELDLFSDAETSGPFTLSARDAAEYYGAPKNLSFSFDRTSGVNGEKVHLTIQVDSAAQYFDGAEFFYVLSTLGDRQQYWPVIVENVP